MSSRPPDVGTLAGQLEARLPSGRVRRQVPFASLTTYRLGGPIAVLAEVHDDDELLEVARITRDLRPRLLVIGRGSNLLVADRGFDGLALVLTGDFESVEVSEGLVLAGSATPLPVLARRSAALGRTGLEFFVGIPGSVGGAVAMNAGGHGHDTDEVLVRAWTTDLLGDAELVERPLESLALGYRDSSLRRSEVVVAAEFGVSVDDPVACQARIEEIVRWRRTHQPGGANAGSVFRNPDGDSAGRLIDACGLKGLRIGGALVSGKHANFIQAEAGATAADLRALVFEVQRRVLDQTGIRLEPELRMVGFEETSEGEPVRR
ncbi:MAG: UDP-N-acetylmuramate dehydrogenase [Actinomycetia bacterium]|nr:UDP-N-acetylmuramate dehydrogenase [Actinomycetes bacterium]